MTDTGLGELRRIFGKNNVRDTHAANPIFYEITMNLIEPHSTAWAATEAGSKEMEGEDSGHFRSDRINMYFDLLRHLGHSSEPYRPYYNKDLLYLKKSDIETPQAIAVLKGLSEDNLLNLHTLLVEQQQAQLGSPGDAPDEPEAIRKKLASLTGVSWTVTGDAGNEVYKTLAQVPAARSAAFALGDLIGDDSFYMNHPADRSNVCVPARCLSLEKIQYLNEDISTHFKPARLERVTRT